MKQTLTKALAISSVASLGLFAATNAQATSFTPADTFFNSSISILDGTWTAEGIPGDTLPPPVSDWAVNLNSFSNNDFATFTVRISDGPDEGPSLSPNIFTTSYAITNSKAPIFEASVDFTLVPTNAFQGAIGSITKNIYGAYDPVTQTFTDLLGTANVTVNGNNATFVNAVFSPRSTIYVQDIVNTNAGVLTAYSNTYSSVPEPLTMLGAAAAVGFGSVFKRNAAKKQNKQNSDKA